MGCLRRAMREAGLELVPCPQHLPLQATKATLLSPGTAPISDSSRAAWGIIIIKKNLTNLT